jgi:hypothetical protein
VDLVAVRVLAYDFEHLQHTTSVVSGIVGKVIHRAAAKSNPTPEDRNGRIRV